MPALLRLAVAVASLTALSLGQSPNPTPSFLDFSTFFQVESDPINTNPVKTVTTKTGHFYVAGIFYGSRAEIAAFPKAPVNEIPSVEFRRFRYVARFSAAGELLQWRIVSHPANGGSTSPVLLTVSATTANVVLVYGGTSPAENSPAAPF